MTIRPMTEEERELFAEIDRLQILLNRYSSDTVRLTLESTIAAQQEQIARLTAELGDLPDAQRMLMAENRRLSTEIQILTAERNQLIDDCTQLKSKYDESEYAASVAEECLCQRTAERDAMAVIQGAGK